MKKFVPFTIAAAVVAMSLLPAHVDRQNGGVSDE